MLGVRLAKLTSNPDLVISDGESLFLGGTPAAVREGRRGRGLDPVPARLRRRRLRQAPRDDGRDPGRQARQPEHLRDRRLRAAEAPAARARGVLRATRSTTGRRTGSRSTALASSSRASTSSPASARRAPRRPDPEPRSTTTSTGSSRNLGVFDVEGRGRHRAAAVSVHPGVTVDEVVEATGFELGHPGRRPRDPRADRGGADPDPRGARPQEPAVQRGAAEEGAE